VPVGVDPVVEIAIVDELVPLLVIVCGLNDALAPTGSPDALKVTPCGLPLTSGAVTVVVPDVPPWVAVSVVGAADTEKSSGGGGGAADALNSAMPAAQYIAVGKVAPKLCAAVEVNTCEPVTTDTWLGVAVLCCGSTANPGDVTVMVCAFAWPAMKPTASSLVAAGVTAPEFAEAEVAEVAPEVSSGLVATIPLNSCTRSATVDAAVVTVTLLTDAAFGAYHSSPSEYWPETNTALALVQVFLPSVTAVISWLAPV
jgi:hypothetical protein